MPRRLLVAENTRAWTLALPGVDVVTARDYLTAPEFARLRNARVFNVCRTNSYQTVGYYVSLLAAARGHRPLPSVTTIQDLRSAPLIRIASDELQADIQRALGPLKGDTFTLSIYFGRNLARRYDRLCHALFAHFPAPFLRAEFARTDRWRLESLRPIAAGDIPDGHREFVADSARRFFARPTSARRSDHYRYDLAILFDPDEIDAPSDERAIRKVCRAAERHGLRPTLIGREDYGRVAEFDALFIRETTAVNHHTYRFARRAEAEGLVVIDDPTSIIRCTNKVYLAEVFARHGIPCPPTLVVHRDNAASVAAELGLPCVLKAPDSSFSRGVVRADTEAELERHLAAILAESELAVAQRFMPTEYDWRIALLAGRPLFACRYHMVRGHWQIQRSYASNARRYGRVDAVALDDVPPRVLALARRACRPIGDGLYGVDIKQVGSRALVIEINDNPNLEAGVEDRAEGDAVYDAIARVFAERLDRRGQPRR
ncbi:MAG: RimK family alpha-L-glutamate ligase [Deltaproteobacteria bacterium]|nr:MAG: RimK family alpha-L-glutamate ligase [Deltaproteobacteria bacterium]